MLFPYMPCFEKKNMQKTPMSTILMLLVMNGMFVFMIPSGVGLYYFVSSLFTVIEQFIFLLSSLKTLPTYDKITLNWDTRLTEVRKWKHTSRNLLSLCLLLFKTSGNAWNISVFKGLRTFGENAKVSYFIGKWCSLRQKWCSKWCSEIGTETSNVILKWYRDPCACRVAGAWVWMFCGEILC